MRQIKTQRYVLKYNIIYFDSFIGPDLQNHAHHQDMFQNIFVCQL